MKVYEHIFLNVQHPLGLTPFNPFQDAELLSYAVLLDTYYHTIQSRFAVLIDLRTAENILYQTNHIGLLIAHNVTSIFSESLRVLSKPHHLMIVGQMFAHNHLFAKEVVFTAREDVLLRIRASKFTFYTGYVSDIGEVATSLDEGIDNYLATTPHFASEYQVSGVIDWD